MKHVLLVLALSVLVGCAGPQYTVTPMSKTLPKIDRICVVDNADLTPEFQGLVNRTVNSAGYTSYPISSPVLAKEIGCELYLTYGGNHVTDIVEFMNTINVVVYDSQHTRVASSHGKVPNNLRLDKWKAAEELIQKMVLEVLSR